METRVAVMSIIVEDPAAVEKLKNHGNEIYLGVSVRNERKYINPVRNEKGELIGYFERFEMNLQK